MEQKLKLMGSTISLIKIYALTLAAVQCREYQFQFFDCSLETFGMESTWTGDCSGTLCAAGFVSDIN